MLIDIIHTNESDFGVLNTLRLVTKNYENHCFIIINTLTRANYGIHIWFRQWNFKCEDIRKDQYTLSTLSAHEIRPLVPVSDLCWSSGSNTRGLRWCFCSDKPVILPHLPAVFLGCTVWWALLQFTLCFLPYLAHICVYILDSRLCFAWKPWGSKGGNVTSNISRLACKNSGQNYQSRYHLKAQCKKYGCTLIMQVRGRKQLH